MTPEKLLAIVVCALALIFPTLAQQDDCNLDELFAYNTLETLIQNSVMRGDNPPVPTIVVHDTHTVCLSVGPSMGNVSSISLLVDYSCTRSGQCANWQSANKRNIEQFDFGCSSQNRWSIGQYFDFTVARHENPIANFDTALRMDCAACFTQHPSFSSSFLPFDQVTHCVSKFMIHCSFIHFMRLVVTQLCRVSFVQTVLLIASVLQSKRLCCATDTLVLLSRAAAMCTSMGCVDHIALTAFSFQI